MNLRHIVATVVLLPTLSAHAFAEEPPQFIFTRFTGVPMNAELEFGPSVFGWGARGLQLTLAGAEVGWTRSSGLTLETDFDSLTGPGGAGWSVAARGGWQFKVHGEPTRTERGWFGAIVPLAGLRFARIPHSGTSDGYSLKRWALGPQLGAAYDLSRAGPGPGFTGRIGVFGNHRSAMWRVPSSGWDYASPAAGAPLSLEAAVSLGVVFGL